MKLWYSLAVLVAASLAIVVLGSAAPPQQNSSQSASPVEPALPSDIDPKSRARLPLVNRDQLDDLGKKMYDLIVSPQARTLAGLQGPYGIWLYSPRVAEHSQPLNYYLRYETHLGRRLTELAILVTARELDNQFEWTSHEPAAVKEGLEPQIIDVVRYGQGLGGLGDKEALVISFGRELFQKKKVSSQTFARARKLFGDQGVVDLAALMGDYASVSALIDAFDIQLRADQKPLLPMQQPAGEK